MNKFISFLVASIILLMLNGCGFQLRNEAELSQRLHTLYLEEDNPYGSLESSLRQTLRASGTVLVDNAKAAPITLHIYKPTQTNLNNAIGPSSQSRAYALIYSVNFSLADSQGKILLGPEIITASRTLILSPNQLPQSNNQIDVLIQQMERDIINKLYNRLRSKQVADLL